MTGDVVELPAGAVVLTGAATLHASLAVRLMIEARRRDGIGPSAVLAELAGVLDRAAAQVVRSARVTPEPPLPVEVSLSTTDLIGTTEAASMLAVSEGYVRRMCRRESLVSARRVGAVWLVDRAEVVERKRAS